MAEKLVCPILKAGTMIQAVHTQTNHTTVHDVHTESPLCLEKQCAWWDSGYKRCVIQGMIWD